jgi:hypothetical protein
MEVAVRRTGQADDPWMLKPGDKLLIAHRRLFEEDQPRFFVGQVLAWEGGVAKVSGHAWVRERVRADYARKPDERIKFVPLASGSIMAYQLPDGVELARLVLRTTTHGLVLTDDAGFAMDLTDRVPQVNSKPAR